jgi:hypothetical protein
MKFDLRAFRRQCPLSSGKIGFLRAHSPRRGGVAQLAEQRTHKPRVTRSIRVTATKPHFVRTGGSPGEASPHCAAG